MQIIIQMLSLVIFGFILASNCQVLKRLLEEDFKMLAFIVVNLAMSVV
jgi:hypothetical protein